MIREDAIPQVSIIVPVYNMEKYIRQCLDSLLSQTLSDIEIICVNDKSTDNSLAILYDYQKKDSRVNVIDLPKNIKQGGARNAGIKQARGKYLGFVDSDDWVASEMYANLYEKAIDKNADLVCCDYYAYYGENDLRLQINIDEKICSFSRDERNKKLIVQGLRLYTVIVKKELFINNDILFPENLFYEDNAVVSALYLCADKIVKVSRPYYYYRCNNVSTTRAINNYRFFDRLETSFIYLNNMKRLGFYGKYKQEVDYRFIVLYFINSIMGAVSQFSPPEIKYIEQIKKEIKSTLPDFMNNVYYKKEIPLKIRVFLSLIMLNTSLGVKLYVIFSKLKRR